MEERKYVFSFSGSNEETSWELIPHSVWWRRWLGQVELIRKTKRVIDRHSLEFKTDDATAMNSYFQSGLKVMADMVCDEPECFQLEEGSFPTSYIPTNGTPVTRKATGFEWVDCGVKFFGEPKTEVDDRGRESLLIEPQRTNLFINSETNKK